MSITEKVSAYSPNFRRWANYCEPFPTHDRFVIFGWLWMVGAALQRRVWMDTKPVYPNNYFLLVAPPGVGKGNVSDAVRGIFESMTSDPTPATGIGAIRKGKLLFPISADSSSYEAFVQFTSKSMSTHRYTLAGSTTSEPYYYCAPAFILDEAASIFHREAHNMATFLLSGWTCAPSYVRDTISRQEEVIHNLCINLIGGIQPGKLGELARLAIIENGFSRRCLMVYGATSNKRRAMIEHTKEQFDDYKSLAPHIRKLAKKFGPVQITPAAREFLLDIFERNALTIFNRDPAIEHYYPTKIVHTKKLAMALHFSDHEDLMIDAPAFQLAYDLLNEIEPDMHYAYVRTDDVRAEVIKIVRSVLKSTQLQNPDGLSAGELYPEVVTKLDYDKFCVLLHDLTQAKILNYNNNLYQLPGR